MQSLKNKCRIAMYMDAVIVILVKVKLHFIGILAKGNSLVTQNSG